MDQYHHLEHNSWCMDKCLKMCRFHNQVPRAWLVRTRSLTVSFPFDMWANNGSGLMTVLRGALARSLTVGPRAWQLLVLSGGTLGLMMGRCHSDLQFQILAYTHSPLAISCPVLHHHLSWENCGHWARANIYNQRVKIAYY